MVLPTGQAYVWGSSIAGQAVGVAGDTPVGCWIHGLPGWAGAGVVALEHKGGGALGAVGGVGALLAVCKASGLGVPEVD